MLELKSVTKNLNTFCLKDISLELPAGYIMGLIGENGAGKTTLLRLMAGLYSADQGSIRLNGMEYGESEEAVKQEIGVVLHGDLFDGGFNTAEEKTAYGGMRYFVPVLLVLCYIGGMAMSIVCMDSVSRTEFWVIWPVMIIILLPMTIAVGRRWKQIRSNFASYETTAEME